MRYWKCIGNEFNQYFTIDKIYSTDDNGYEIKDDKNDKYPTKVTEMCSAEFIEVKEEGENRMKDLRELIKPCYVVVHRNGELRMVIETTEGMACVNKDGCYIKFDSLDNTLRNIGSAGSDFDIVEVYGFSEYYGNLNKILTNNRELIWKREEISPTQIKLEELEKKQREIADEMEKLRKEL